MSIDALLLQLEQDAEREATRIRGDAQEHATRILARAEADAGRKRALHLEQVAAKLRVASERQVASSRARAREEFLEARASVLNRVITIAAGELERMPIDRYAGSVGKLSADAMQFLERQPAVLRVPAEAVPTVTDAIGRHPGLTIEAGEVASGVIGQSADGRVVVDNTLGAILRRSQADLAVRLTVRIEGG